MSSIAMQLSNLPFEPKLLEELILRICDDYNIRIETGGSAALLVSTGCALVGGWLGRRYGGKVGAAVGSGIAGACGMGLVVAVSLRSKWSEIRDKMQDLYLIVHQYLANLGPMDYCQAAAFLYHHQDNKLVLGRLILNFLTEKLGRTILSELAAA